MINTLDPCGVLKRTHTDDSWKSIELLLSSTSATLTNSVADARDCLIFTSGTFEADVATGASVFGGSP